MTTSTHDPWPEDETLQRSFLERALQGFEAEWQSGRRPDLQQFLLNVPVQARMNCLKGLLECDLRYRRGLGEDPSADDYFLPQLPDLRPQILSHFQQLPDPPPLTPTLTPPLTPPLSLEKTQLDSGMERPEEVPASSQPLPSRIGQYAIERELGHGGMGIVYLGRHQQLGRLAAVKLLRNRALKSQDRQRFALEVEAAARIQHPGVVTIYETGEHDGVPFLAMAYIAGKSLASEVEEAPLPSRQAAGLIGRVAEAVQHLHDWGMIHRDLKPANILLDERSRPYVTDFGLAMLQDRDQDLTASGAVLGTPSYAPPEQLRDSHAVDERSDVYSLGATLYCLLTGRPPFRADSAIATCRQVVEQEPVALRLLNATIPADLETICLKCLQKDSRRRYPTAAALAADLQRFLDGRPITARPVSAWEHFGRWCRRNPWIAGLTSVAALLLIGIATVSTLAYAREAVLVEEKNELATREQRARIRAEQLARQEVAARESAVSAAAVAEQARKRAEVSVEKEMLARRSAITAANEAAAARKRAEEEAYRLQVQLAESAFQRALQEYDAGRHRNADREFASALSLLPVGDDREPGFWQVAWDRVTRQGRLYAPPLRHDTKGILTRPPGSGSDAETLFSLNGGSRPGWWSTASGAPLPDRKTWHWAQAVSPDDTRELQHQGQQARRLLSRPGRQPLAVLEHSAQITSSEFSPNSQFVATTSEDETCRIWLAADGSAWGEPLVHPASVRGAWFSRDSRTVATLSGDVVRLWDVMGESDRPPVEIVHVGATLAGFHPDGKRLATFSLREQNIRLWNLPDGTPVGRALSLASSGEIGSGYFALAFSPDGNYLATISGKYVMGWDLGSNDPTPVAILPHADGVTHVEFLADSTRLLSAGWDGTVCLWDVASLQSSEDLAVPAPVVTAGFTADGSALVVSCADGYVQVHDAATGELRSRWKAHDQAIAAMDFQPGTGNILTAAQDQTVRQWDLRTGRQVGDTMSVTSQVRQLRYALDGQTIAAAISSGQVQFWKADTQQAVGDPVTLPGEVTGMGFHPDSSQLVVSRYDKRNLTISFYDPASGRAVRDDVTVEAGGSRVPALISPDGRHLLVVAASGPLSSRVEWWDSQTLAASRPPITYPEPTTISSNDRWAGLSKARANSILLSLDGDIQEIFLAQISPRGDRIAVAGYSRLARLWNPETGTPVGLPLRHQPHAAAALGSVRQLDFIAGGDQLLTSTDEQYLYRWDSRTGAALGLEKRHPGLSVAKVSEKSNLLVTGSNTAPYARLWTESHIQPRSIGNRDEFALWTGLQLSDGGQIRELELAEWKRLWQSSLQARSPWLMDLLTRQSAQRQATRAAELRRALREGRNFAVAFYCGLELDADPANSRRQQEYQQAVAALQVAGAIVPLRTGQQPAPLEVDAPVSVLPAIEAARPAEIAGVLQEKYRLVAAGRYRMFPGTYVILTRPFYLGETEVTVGQFRKFVEATDYQTQAEKAGGVIRIPQGTQRISTEFTWKSPGFPQTDEHPVAYISWQDANAYCAWLTKQTGVTHRLPTAAEWQWACLAGSTVQSFNYPRDNMGKTWDQRLNEWGWYLGNIGDVLGTRPVRQLKPNAFGLYDMHGNLCEWVSDFSGAYPTGMLTNPAGPASSGKPHHVARGGMFDSDANGCRPDAAGWWGTENFAAYHFGFRVLREIPGAR